MLIINVIVIAASCCALLTEAEPEPGRVPKVYNALITSSQNLAPSKSFPIYQPVLQEYPFPYGGGPPVLQPTLFYDPRFKYDQTIGQRGYPPIVVGPEQQPASTEQPQSTDKSDDNNSKDTKTGNTNQQPPAPPSTESPITLNQFGLPPNVIPLNKLTPPQLAFDPYTYNPYYQNNPYDYNQFYPFFEPNPFNIPPPVYKFPGQETETPKGTDRRNDDNADTNMNTLTSSVQPETADNSNNNNNENENKSTPPPAPNDLDVNNYKDKNPNIPDVPPPPLPRGGLKE